MSKLFDNIIDVTKIYLGEHDILAKVHKVSNSGIIVVSNEKEGMSEDANEYAAIIAVGSAVDTEKFPIGNVILAGNGARSNKSFEHKKAKYVIFSSHSIGIMLDPTNFKPTADDKKAV
jgi:co-chaperonin GroES (HSP10)